MEDNEKGAHEGALHPAEASVSSGSQTSLSFLAVKLSRLIQRVDSLERRISRLEPSISSIASDELPTPPDRKQKLLFGNEEVS